MITIAACLGNSYLLIFHLAYDINDYSRGGLLNLFIVFAVRCSAFY